MGVKTAVVEHSGQVVTKGQFKHVMAITLDPSSGYRKGVIRCITKREGDVGVKGFIDRSVLHCVYGSSLNKFKIGSRLNIKNEKKIIDRLCGQGREFIGLEDPDIWIDEKAGLTHFYFTIPLLGSGTRHSLIHLGHAVGKDLNSLCMTMPVLFAKAEKVDHAKEVSIAPANSRGVRLNLIESKSRKGGISYSTVRVAIAEDMGKPWKFGKTVFHPAKNRLEWIAGHASPGPLFPDTFIDVGRGKRLGVINGREANRNVGDKTIYGVFSVGLFIYDYEAGKIDWVSSKPLIRDSKARTITFASQFVQTKKDSGILYAHVDDSFVRAYTLNPDGIKKLLP
jgi:hypothetical protein